MAFNYHPQTPMYDPQNIIRNYKYDEDFQDLKSRITGTGRLFEDNRTIYQFSDHDKEWRRPKEICGFPIFVDGKPSRFDAIQGAVSDCWLISAIEGLTFHSRLIRFVVPQDQGFDYRYIGAFHFRIWRLGTWYDVVVDDRLPVFKVNGKLCFGHSERGNIFWAPLLEKAYMKMCAADLVKPEYGNIALGFPVTSMQDLSGGIIESIDLAKWSNINYKAVLERLQQYQALMCCARNSDRLDLGIHGMHAYAVTKVFKVYNDSSYAGLYLIRVLNPYGKGEWTGPWSDNDYRDWRQVDLRIRGNLELVQRDDGEFWMDENDFVRIFQNLWICHMGPSQYVGAHHPAPPVMTWKTSYLRGEWVRGVSAGGSDVLNRHRNPQYRFLLQRDENDVNRDGKCTVVIELTQRSKTLGRANHQMVGFFVYPLPPPFNNLNHLDQQFFLSFKPLNEPTPGLRGGSTTLDLLPGFYCVVPCTEFEGVESQFLLRVFSESIVDYQGDRISKALLTNDEVVSSKITNESLQKLFDDAADGKGEIDWLGLKIVLKTAMNPQSSYFGFIFSIFRYIRNIIKHYFRLSPNKDSTDAIGFTKDECRSMIAMMDLNHSGKLNFLEFTNLLRKIYFWSKVYEQHLGETKDYLTVTNLKEALSSTGYEMNRRVIHSLSYIYANDEGQISLADFIMCGVAVETVVSRHLKDEEKSGNKFTFTLEEWVKNTLLL